MASGRQFRILKCKVLQAAALGSVKLLRRLLRSVVKRGTGKQRRKSRIGRREEGDIGDKSSSGRHRKSSRKGVGDIGDHGRGRKRKFKEIEEESTSEGAGATGDDSSSGIETPAKSSRHTSEFGRDGGNEEIDGRGLDGSTGGDRVRSVVNGRDTEGLSPLHHACLAGSEKLVKYLISKGAGVHARDSRGNTPLHIAAKLGPSSLISLLRKAGADPEAFNDEGVTPSDILDKEESAMRASVSAQQENWYSHLAEHVSDQEDNWWGKDFDEENRGPRRDWEDLVLERMAESRQDKGLYSDGPFSLKDFLRQEKLLNEKKPRETKRTERSAKSENRRGPEEVVLKQQRAQVDVTLTYRQRWEKFSTSYNLCLSFSDVPFPVDEGNEEFLGGVLLRGVDPSMHRVALRKEILRWHPDKFLQKWGPKLQGPDHDRIVERVNGISQAIHMLYKDLPTSSEALP